MNKTIITPLEVIKNSSISSKVSTKFLCDHIPQVEMTFARTCLGADLYNRLLGNIRTFTKIEAYDPTKAYMLCDKVNYFGILLESTINSNTVNPCDDTNGCWTEGKKFRSKCFNDLWCNGLKDYLAYAVLCESLEYMTYEIGAMGLVEKSGEHYRTAAKGTFNTVKTKILKDTNTRLDNLIFYMECNAERCGWEDCLFLQRKCGQDSSCTKLNTGQRTIYFKR